MGAKCVMTKIVVNKKIQLININAPHFCAGLEMHNGKIKVAAPILYWMQKRNMTEDEIIAYCVKKKWDVQVKYIDGMWDDDLPERTM